MGQPLSVAHRFRARKPRTKTRSKTKCTKGSCKRCKSDQAFLRRKTRPKAAQGSPLRVVDLFAGCGGMSIGLEEAALRFGRPLEVPLAVDSDEDVIRVFKANVPDARAVVADVASLFDGKLGKRLTKNERRISKAVGTVDVLLGGPPCQGHSDLNNHTRRNDPKNALYLRMARAAEVLEPRVLVIENVATVELDKAGVVATAKKALNRAGFKVDGRVLDLRRVGVPQRRRRYLLVASRVSEIDPTSLLEELASGMPDHPHRTVHWAMHDMMTTKPDTPFDTPSRPTKANAKRIDFLFDKDEYDLPNRQRPECHRDGNHSYVSMYGRLRWDEPAQTITTGFGSMGQGRYVHPQCRRTITPHEAARLQTFPDWFDFGKKSGRCTLAKMIGNAVPPILMVALGDVAIPSLDMASRARERKPA